MTKEHILLHETELVLTIIIKTAVFVYLAQLYIPPSLFCSILYLYGLTIET